MRLLVRKLVQGALHPRWPAVLLGALLGVPAGVILCEALFGAAALLLAATATAAAPVAEQLPWSDPVYTHAALNSLGNVHPARLALAAPLDAVLHTSLEPPVQSSNPAPGRLIHVVLEPGSSVSGRLAASELANVSVLCLGLLAVRSGLGWRRWGLVVFGMALQGQVAASILGAPPSPVDLETIGVSFALDMAVPSLFGRGLVVSRVLESWPEPVLAAALVAAALLIAYVPALVLSGWTVWAWRRGRRVRPGASAPRRRSTRSAVPVVSACTVLGVGAVLAACGSPGRVDTQPSGGPAAAVAPGAVNAQPVRTERLEATGPQPPNAARPKQPPGFAMRRLAEASNVRVIQRGDSWAYLVNGQPEVIKGMGLNTQYVSVLSQDERRARLDADLSELSALGVNTLVGWDPREFDDVLLDLADAHGIGVVMPFDLDPSADYTDPAIRSSLHAAVLAWVARYRRYPAVRMWGIGNEVLHKIVHPAWVGPQDPAQERQARAFADWLIETADAVHAADADHPVTYRDAEDAFTSWIATALARRPAGARPWFVYGTNCYQDYLSDIVDNWGDQGLGTALWVSEFAPGGLGLHDRPEGFRSMWGFVRRQPGWVLGGAVYAWTRNGPEEIDRTLGLTDDGEPFDTGSLGAISAAFQETEALDSR
jgi:hypothetical protein